MAKLVKVYGKAFFELALETQSVSEFEQGAKLVLDAFKADKDLKTVLTHPDISEAKKLDVLKELFGDKVPENFLGLFDVVITKRRENHLEAILEDVLERILDYKGILIAEVVSPIELTDAQLSKIKEKLNVMFNKQIVLEVCVDTSLIAGLKIVVGGYALDSSFKKQLSDLKNTLYNAQLA